MQTELVSIMMPAYNAERFIGQAIESVLAQSCQHWELIVVNDGSTDRTPQIIAGYTDPRIKIFHQENGGESSARNTALEHVSGEHLAFLDADDLYLPEHLEMLVAYLQSHSQFDGVYSDGYYIDENGKQLKTLSSRRRGPFEGDIFEEMVRASDVFGAPVCVMLRNSVISKKSLNFDTNIVIGPDWDFFIRFAEVAEFGNISQPTCLYRIHQMNISIQTNRNMRLLHLAKCRENIIKLNRFKECRIETRNFVFYDLLVNLLTGYPERQAEITRWDEFTELPTGERAKLFRLMASESLIQGITHRVIGEWLYYAYRLDSTDRRNALLNAIYRINPNLCRIMLRLKRPSHTITMEASPFVDLA